MHRIQTGSQFKYSDLFKSLDEDKMKNVDKEHTNYQETEKILNKELNESIKNSETP